MQMPAWTYSQLDSFESCPKKYYHLKVVRDIIEPQTVHTVWGTTVHTAMELRVRDGTPLPTGMGQWEGIAAKIAAIPGIKYAEQKMALDQNFQPTDWKTAWTRGIADLNVVSTSSIATLDYKTGKRKPTEQTLLYAAYNFAYHPEVDTVHTGLVWLKEKKIDRVVVRRDELPAIWQMFMPRYQRLLKAYEKDRWPPNPSGLCNGWCPVTSCCFYKPKR